MGIGKVKGKYRIKNVSIITNNKANLIYTDEDKRITGLSRPHTIEEIERKAARIEHSSIKLKFITPVRIVFESRLSPKLEFHVLIRRLLSRISALYYFHHEKRFEIDFKELIKKAEKVKIKESCLNWHDWERYSNRQQQRMKMGGLLGDIIYEGELKDFLPLLVLGEHIHVGKGTSMGLGRYEIKGSEIDG